MYHVFNGDAIPIGSDFFEGSFLVSQYKIKPDPAWIQGKIWSDPGMKKDGSYLDPAWKRLDLG